MSIVLSECKRIYMARLHSPKSPIIFFHFNDRICNLVLMVN